MRLLAAALAVAAVVMLWRYASLLRDLKVRLSMTERELQHVQQSCSMLAPPSVVQKFISEGVTSSAETKVATVMFIDLVGFTEISERLEAPALAELLNGYFQRVSDAVTEHRGRIGTFLGDGVLAYFGAFEPNPWQADDAVVAALGLARAMREYSDEVHARGLPKLNIGIGIHRGIGLAGLVGSHERMEYAFVGRTVNTAARVQTLTRAHDCAILITEAVREQLDPKIPLRAFPPVNVKGIREPLATFEVIDSTTTQPSESASADKS